MKVFNLAEELEKERKKNKELEQELKEANESITWWTNRYKALEKLCNKYEEEHKTTFGEWKKDITANKRAIEYIKENCYDEERKMVINELYNEIPELLNILNGDNK